MDDISNDHRKIAFAFAHQSQNGETDGQQWLFFYDYNLISKEF